MFNKLYILIRKYNFITTVCVINIEMLNNLSCNILIDLERYVFCFALEKKKVFIFNYDYSIKLLLLLGFWRAY